ncbi:MAG TPA: FmdB family zinc ribbon protein [Candidatus Limnocylindrales bacterium]|nr:FmdB family zinc ribbon protein [Candidatus Limnocylindrales bacterium]
MPTYQYACTACGHQLEAVQSFADEPLTECPTCEGRLRKLFSGIGVVFKGSGFYRTDSRTDSRADSRADSSAGDKPASSSNSSSSADGSSKPAEKKSESKTSASTSSTAA